MERGDWEAFFACLDRTELRVIAGNSVKLLAAAPHPADSPLRAPFAAYAFPLAALEASGREIVQSAEAMLRSPAPPAEQRQQSLRHRELVERYQDVLDAGLKGVADLSGFTAALERAMRSASGGGSVSSRLFVGETLHDVVIDGTKARGKRRLAGGSTEDIAFVRRKGDWYIRIPKRRS
jgi:hypothetical protein